MTKTYRISLAVIGVMALVATAVFVKIAVWPEASDASNQAIAEKPKRVASTPDTAPSADTGLVFDHPESSLIANAAVASVPVYPSAGAAKPTKNLRHPTMEGMPLLFAVKERQEDWIKVQLPVRPNEATGWVRASDVKVQSISTHIVVEVEKRKLSAFQGQELLMEAPVGVGTAKTPTPLGTFYVDFSVRNPGPGYGAHMLSVAGFSNVLKNFGGGIGQIAIHGTNNDGSVGEFSSNGCLRMTNEDVVRLAELVKAGSPVFILA